MAQTPKLAGIYGDNPSFEAGRQRARSYLRLGDEIRQLRELHGLTQGDVALKSGIDQAEISRLENGKWGARGISFDVLARLMPVLGLELAHEVRVRPIAEEYADRTRESAIIITELLHVNA